MSINTVKVQPSFIVNAVMFCEPMIRHRHSDYVPSAQNAKYYCAYYKYKFSESLDILKSLENKCNESKKNKL